MHIYLYAHDRSILLNDTVYPILAQVSAITTNSSALWHQLKDWGLPVTRHITQASPGSYAAWKKLLNQESVTETLIVCDRELATVKNLRSASSALNIPYNHL